MKSIDDDPLAFPCPRCGLTMAVTHVDGVTDIFHKKPTCAAFNHRDRDYKNEVFKLDREKRAER